MTRKTIDANQLDDEVFNAIVENMGFKQSDSEDHVKSNEMIDMVDSLTPEQAFSRYCEWHGLINWSLTLTKVLDNIRQSLLDEVHPTEQWLVPNWKWIAEDPRRAIQYIKERNIFWVAIKRLEAQLAGLGLRSGPFMKEMDPMFEVINEALGKWPQIPDVPEQKWIIEWVPMLPASIEKKAYYAGYNKRIEGTPAVVEDIQDVAIWSNYHQAKRVAEGLLGAKGYKWVVSEYKK